MNYGSEHQLCAFHYPYQNFSYNILLAIGDPPLKKVKFETKRVKKWLDPRYCLLTAGPLLNFGNTLEKRSCGKLHPVGVTDLTLEGTIQQHVKVAAVQESGWTPWKAIVISRRDTRCANNP